LVAALGLPTEPLEGGAVFFAGRKINSTKDLARELGEDVARDVAAWSADARRHCSPADYYEDDAAAANSGPLASRTYAELLLEVAGPVARRFIEIVAHSDVAAEPHATSAMYGLQNWLMNEEDYMRLYVIPGGLQRIADSLAARLRAEVRLGCAVETISAAESGGYRVQCAGGVAADSRTFDQVVLALPITHLSGLKFDDAALARGLFAHLAHYDHPAHYLRVTMAFEQPFWRDHVAGSYFMIDGFGGACLYDQTPRDGRCGVLGWLIAGDPALTHANLPDDELVRAALASLPEPLRTLCPSPLESTVDRWVGAVNAWPMGRPIQEAVDRHRPAPDTHPGVFVVGDYLFDSTLNGVLDSADMAADLISELANK
jgi:monoamine oxidase